VKGDISARIETSRGLNDTLYCITDENDLKSKSDPGKTSHLLQRQASHRTSIIKTPRLKQKGSAFHLPAHCEARGIQH